MRNILFCLFIFTAPFLLAEEPTKDTQKAAIRHWIEQLGDDSFVVRQRAEAHLLRTGIDAITELQRAKKSSDIEIARRAEQLLGRIELLFIGKENGAVGFWIRLYMTEVNPAAKAQILWILVNSFSDASKGEGLQTLCRIARFDENRSLRAEAVKCLIASPPLAPSLISKWYRYIRDLFADPGDDELLRLLSEYAKLRCDLDTGVTPDLTDRVRKITDLFAEFQSNPENRGFQPGNVIDILFFYALAELQDRVGLTADRDKAVAAALTVRMEPLQSTEPLQEIEQEDGKNMNEHFYAGRWLTRHYRLKWALPHLQLAIDEGESLVKLSSCLFASEALVFMADYSGAAKIFDKCLEIVGSDGYAKLRNDAAKWTAIANARKSLCFGEQAAAEGNWHRVQEHVTAGLAADPSEVDLLILAYRLGQQRQDLDQTYRDQVKSKIDIALAQTEREIHAAPNPEERQKSAISACNKAAWLLANTGGDYSSALALIETALISEPEDCGLLDTLAHVYYLGKEYDKAIQTEEQVVRLAPEAVVFQQALERFRKRGK